MTKQPWDVPDAEAHGDPPGNELYTAVGVALSTWEGLEESLARLFMMFCGSSSLAPQLAYGSIIAHTSRNTMLRTAAESYFFGDEANREAVLEFLNRVGQWAGRRNDIAHGHVVAVGGANGEALGNYLLPPFYQTNKSFFSTFRKSKNPLGKYQLTSKQIYTIAAGFSALNSEAHQWWMKLVEQHAASLEKPPGPDTQPAM